MVYGLYVISPVIGLLTPSLAKRPPPVWRRHRGVRTTRFRRPPQRPRQKRIRVHRIPPRVRDDREPPLSLGRDGNQNIPESTRRSSANSEIPKLIALPNWPTAGRTRRSRHTSCALWQRIADEAGPASAW